MTTETNYREKTGAVFFAVLMVVSMVAMPLGLAGSAAALDDSQTTVDVGNTNTGATTTHTWSTETDSAESNEDIQGIVLEYGDSGVGLSNVDESDVTLKIDGTNEDLGDFNINGSEIRLELADSVSGNTDIPINATVDDVRNPAAEGSFDVSIETHDTAFSANPTDGLIDSSSTTLTTTASSQDPLFQIDDFTTSTSIIAQGDTLDAGVTVSNVGNTSGNTTVALTLDNNAGTSTELVNKSVNLSAGETTTVSFSEEIGTDVTVDEYDIDATAADDSGNVDDTASSTLSVTDPADNAFITGDIRDQFGNQIPDAELIDIEIVDDDTDTVVATVNTADEYTVEVPVEAGGTNYTVRVDGDQAEAATGVEYRSFARTAQVDTGSTEPFPVRLRAVVNPDEIDVTFDPGTSVQVEETIEATVTVQTEDADGDSSTLDPLADTPVELTYDDNTAEDAAADAILPASGTTATTNDDGEVTFEFNVSSSNLDEVQEVIEASDLTFEATSGDNVVTEPETLEFVPEIGDTGTLSGQVDVVDEDIQLGTEANVESTAGVEVHAVQLDNLLENTVRVNETGADIEELSNETLTGLEGIDDFDDTDLSVNVNYAGVGGDETGLGDVRLDQGDQIRVVTFTDDGEAVVQDPRSDYLTHTPNGVELIQNETDQSVEIHATNGATNPSFDLSFLENRTDYQVQQKVVLTNTSSGESVTTYQNITVDTGLDGTLQTNTEDVFEATEDLTYDAVDERFEGERAVPTDTTNEQGNFELFNLPVNVDSGQDYAVIAGGDDTGSADTAYGFANFRGFDVVEVNANAQTGVDQTNVDLSVQEFEPSVNLGFELDVTVADGQKFAETPVDEPVSVEVTAQQFEIGGDEDLEPAENVEIDLSALNPAIGEFADTTVVTDDEGVATTTFTGDAPQVGSTNISAAIEFGNEITETEGGEQATVDVFQDAQITGDVVDDETPSNNLPGASVTLFVENETGELEELANTTAGPTGSFSFTGEDGVRSGLNYTVEATFEGEEGNIGTGFAQLTNIPGGTTNADIVIEDVVAPEGFEISDLAAPAQAAPGDEITVTANITNTAGEEAADDVTFFFNGSDVDSQELTLDPGETSEVTFDVTVPDVADGDYEHGIETSVDTAIATLTVTSDNPDNGTEESPVDGVTQEQFDAVLPNGTNTTLGELRASVDDWIDNGQVDGVNLTLGELRSIVDYWSSNQ